MLRVAQEHLDSKNFYAFNPEFDMMGPRARQARANQMGNNGGMMDGGHGMMHH